MREIRAFSKSPEQFPANDKIAILFIHLQGHEICELPGSLEEDPKSQRGTATPADPFLSARCRHEGRTQSNSIYTSKPQELWHNTFALSCYICGNLFYHSKNLLQCSNKTPQKEARGWIGTVGHSLLTLDRYQYVHLNQHDRWHTLLQASYEPILMFWLHYCNSLHGTFPDSISTARRTSLSSILTLTYTLYYLPLQNNPYTLQEF